MTTPEIAWIIGDILSDNAARSASFGATSALRFPWKVAVKTGTSSDFHDNWCVGYTPEITIGVWMGNLDASPMPGLSGVSGAGPIFHRIMMEMAQRRTLTWPDRPPGVMPVILDARIGKLANSETPLESQVMDFCLVGHPPKPCTGNDFSSDGLPLLDDATYAQWFHGQPHGQVQLASAGRAALPPLPPQILSPMPHAIYVLDPELPNGGTKLPLRSTLLQDARWSSETLAINPQQTCATLVPGHHRIQLQNIAAGTRSEVWIEVQGH